MSRPDDGLPEVIGFKIDECPTCRRTGGHLLTHSILKAGLLRRTESYRLICTTCGTNTSVPVNDARGASMSGLLRLPRPRPGFDELMRAGPVGPVSPNALSPYETGNPDAYVAARLTQARAGLAGGTSTVQVQGLLYDQFLPNPAAKPAPRPRLGLAAVAGALVILVFGAVGAFALFAMPTDDGGDTTAANLVAEPTVSPTSSADPTPLVSVSPTTLPTLDPTPEPVRSLDPEATLLSHVPSSMRERCEPLGGRQLGSALAGLRCGLEEPSTTVDYLLFAGDDVDRAFLEAREAVNIVDPGQACFNGGGRQYSDWRYGDVPGRVGEITCYRRDGSSHVLWSHRADSMLIRATSPEATMSKLMRLWLSQKLAT